MDAVAIPDSVKRAARIELSRRLLYDYCQTRYPAFYTDDKVYLKTVCNTLQNFMGQNDKRILVLTMPPRHGKSFTAKNLTEWLFGENPALKVMTGSYNETLSTTFARQVRDTIDERPTGGPIVYREIYPKTKVKYGEASANLWALEGNAQKSYLATSPTGTATGFGANVLILDDIIKNSDEAYNEAVLQKHWDWFSNTMMQRLEGHDWKIIIIMTRWSTNDLAGLVLKNYPNDAYHISFKAVQDDGTMLCPTVLNKADYELKTREMSREIVEANYNQQPLDVQGRLYEGFKTWVELPTAPIKRNYTDTADTGADWLCSVDYIEHAGDVYVTDLVFTNAPMEVTEPAVAQMFNDDGVNEATIESNNGGRGFARNIGRLLIDNHQNNSVIITPKTQTHNKEARILTSSAWVQNHVYMPPNWQGKYPEFYKQLMSYVKQGRNRHDDAPDVLAGIYEQVTDKKPGITNMAFA